MTTDEYLRAVLAAQDLDANSEEQKTLDKHEARVTKLLEKAFPDSTPTIDIGGSRAKGTMIKDAHDLDMICYFPHEESEPGDSLKEIYRSVKGALEPDYYVEEKRSSLRLRGNTPSDFRQDTHVDVVPGRYVDDTKSDTYLHQTSGEKSWLKTNLRTHIRHVRQSRVLDGVRLMKLWKARNAVDAKTFVLELAVIKLLTGKKALALEQQLLHVWESFRDDIDNLSVEDPANSNNDLKPALDTVRYQLSTVAASTLATIDGLGWEAVFGAVEDESAKGPSLIVGAAAAVARPTRPFATSR